MGTTSRVKEKKDWVNRGFLSACECFSCTNKVAHEFKGYGISVLCKDHCNYEARKDEPRNTVPKLNDLEQVK